MIQPVPDTGKLEAALRNAFDTDIAASPSQCAATPIRPELDYSLRFQTGFKLDLPAAGEARRTGMIVVRITPEEGRPVFLANRLRFPESPQKKASGHIDAGFAVTEGSYKVDLLYQENGHNVCRSNWSVQAKSDADRRLSARQHRRGKLTVLVHVAPPSPSLARVPAADAERLLGTLTALLNHTSTGTVRVIAFNLTRRRILYRKDDFVPADLEELSSTIRKTQFAVVDYSSLRNPKAAADLLVNLADEAGSEMHSADSLVFLGARLRQSPPFPSGRAKKLPGGPRIFYLQCDPPRTLLNTPSSSVDFAAPTASLPPQLAGYFDDPIDTNIGDTPKSDTTISAPIDEPDVIEQYVRKIKGQVIAIRKPNDCARAIERVARDGKSDVAKVN